MYLRAISSFEDRDVDVVSSYDLAANVGLGPAQVRRDLSYFGRFGTQNRGYEVALLGGELRRVLRIDRVWRTALVGVGRLGRAIAAYPGFSSDGVRIVAAFDADPDIIGMPVGHLTVQPMSSLRTVVADRSIRIGIVAVTAAHAQGVIDELVGAGIGAILNYTPLAARVPPSVQIRNVDPVLELQSMTFYLED